MSFPLYNMNFNQRLEHFNNKKDLDLEKIKKDLVNIEEDIYTFYPRTNKYIQKINYENRIKNENISKNNNSKRKTKINYKRLNELYMDYKERNARIKKLEKENNIKDGISFNPYFINNNEGIKRSKDKNKKIFFSN